MITPDQQAQLSSTAAPASTTPTEVAIAVRGLSKMYPLYAKPSDRLKQSLWHALPRFLRGQLRQFYREFWALRDISFTVEKGETVGIIGRNGSGKSTLLQIIAGTLAPSEGEVEVSGRVAALLELGSGFNPEFTGRENVYLNGAIWGLSRPEIDSIFDEIAAFADIGQFMDQPVKLYSSGMFVRLAFAVQVGLPKEILIVDEVLAVGDEAFQRKCMRALEEFQAKGGTVLFVSHDTQAVTRLCREAVLLVNGQMMVKERSKLVTDIYQRLLYSPETEQRQLLESMQTGTHEVELARLDALPLHHKSVEKLLAPKAEQPPQKASYDPQLQQSSIEKSYGNGKAEIIEVYLQDETGQRVNVVVSGQRYRWLYRVRFHQAARYVHFGMMLKTIDGIRVYAASTLHDQQVIDHLPAGAMVEVSFQLDLNLVPGTYFLNCGVSAMEIDKFVYLHRRVDAAAIRVQPLDNRTYDGLAFMNHTTTYTLLTGEGVG